MARQKSAWDKLSMNERAQFIRLGLQQGLSNLKDIRDTYNLYKAGGYLGHWKDGTQQKESQDLNYPNLLPEVTVTPKWYEKILHYKYPDNYSPGEYSDLIPRLPKSIQKPVEKAANYTGRVLQAVGQIVPYTGWMYDVVDSGVLTNSGNIYQGIGLTANNPFFKIAGKVLSLPDMVDDSVELYNAVLNRPPEKRIAPYIDEKIISLISDTKKSTGGPLYPFSFEKNPFLKTPVVRYDEGGQKQDASNPGGYTDEQLNQNYQIWKMYDPTGGFNFFNYVASQNRGNLARGEENEYWKEYLGFDSAVPLMNSNAYTEWDKQIEAQKTQNGELTSDFYGTTPRMDYNIQALADTLMLGNMVRNYAEYDKTYDLPHIETITQAYEQAKNILNNPNQWILVDGEIPIGGYRYDSKTSETNPLGMLSHFGMKWVPEENALYMHDTYDFPNKVHKFTDIPIRPREMKIRSKINFDPTMGSWLLRSPVNYNTQIPVTVTK